MEKAKFNVGDTVFYKSPLNPTHNDTGIVLKVDCNKYSFNDTVGYLVGWNNGGADWITGVNLTLTLDQTNQSWNREGQSVLFNYYGTACEGFVSGSRTTLGGKVKHYLTDNQGNCVIVYENDILSVLSENN